MRKIADHPLVFVNDDDVVVIADGQVMCVVGSAAAVASDMVGTFVDDEVVADGRGRRRRGIATMAAVAALIPFTQGSLIAWSSSVISASATSALLAGLVVIAVALFSFVVNDYIRAEYVPAMVPSVDHVLLPGLLPTEADYVDGTTRDKIMSTFKSGDEEALSDLVRNVGGEVRASS